MNIRKIFIFISVVLFICSSVFAESANDMWDDYNSSLFHEENYSMKYYPNNGIVGVDYKQGDKFSYVVLTRYGVEGANLAKSIIIQYHNKEEALDFAQRCKEMEDADISAFDSLNNELYHWATIERRYSRFGTDHWKVMIPCENIE